MMTSHTTDMKNDEETAAVGSSTNISTTQDSRLSLEEETTTETTTAATTTATATTTKGGRSGAQEDNNSNSDNNNSNIQFVDYQDESQLEAVMSLVGRDLSEPYSIFTYRYFLYRFPTLCILAIDTEDSQPIGCVVAKVDAEHNNKQQVTVTTATGSGSEGFESTFESLSLSADTDGDAHAVHDGGDTASTSARNTTTTTSSSSTSKRVHPQQQLTGYIGMLAVSQSHRRKGIGKALVREVIRRMQVDFGCSSVTLETEVTNVTAQKLYQDSFGFVREELLVRYYLNWNDAYRLRLWF